MTRCRPMRCGWIFPVALLLLAPAAGCAHHHANGTYAYAPPYAAPVYPQPYSATQPVVAGVPAGTITAVAPPAGAVVAPPAGAVVAAPVVGGVAPSPVVAAGGVPPCPPMPGATLVGSSDGGGVVVADAQTPACPPAP